MLVLVGLVVAGVVALFVRTVVGTGGGGDTPTPTTASRADRQALVDYEEALDPLAYEAGRVVVQGLRAGLSDLSLGEAEPARVGEMARGWRNELVNLRRQMADLEHPEAVAGAVELFDRGMAGYVATADALIEAAALDGAEREAALDRVVELGERADDVWDRGRDTLLERRRAMGIKRPSPLA